jgi:hypothetical protein
MSTTAQTSHDPILQRERALENANRIRLRRVAERKRIARQKPPAAGRTVARILLEVPEWAQTMPVVALLSAVPYLGEIKARKLAGPGAGSALATLDPAKRAQIAHRIIHLAKGLNANSRPVSGPATEKAQRALHDANRVRLARAAAIAKIKRAPNMHAGAFTLAELITDPEREDCLDGLKLRRLLKAIPHIGEVRARKLIAELHLSETTELGALSELRARQITTAIQKHCHVPAPPPAEDLRPLAA